MSRKYASHYLRAPVCTCSLCVPADLTQEEWASACLDGAPVLFTAEEYLRRDPPLGTVSKKVSWFFREAWTGGEPDGIYPHPEAWSLCLDGAGTP